MLVEKDMERIEQVRPYSIPCYDFVGKDSRFVRVSAIMVPTGFQRKNGELTVAWSCSKGMSCQNRECIYTRRQSEEAWLSTL